MRAIKRRSASNSIAIIGMSGRFPGARNIDEFWQNLRDSIESITPFSAAQLEASGIDISVFNNPNFVPVGSVIEDIDLFDASFFRYSPREAESLDPQQRIFMETAWHALEDAGCDPQTYRGLIGVYGGCAMSTYLDYLRSNPAFVSLLGYLQVYIGNEKDYLTTHTSYKLDLRGPSFSIQTACSTSLLAVAVASDALLSRQCDIALAGGVCVRVPQITGYYYEPGGIYSPDGHCRVFDERAQGVVFGNGVGVVVLKRLADAVRDRDPIRAVVKGWAVNNDGAGKTSYTAPGLGGQVDVITKAHRHAGITPDTITYVETHGTGTTLGDPIEIAALTEAFRRQTSKKNYCAVGSVKTNVGHLDPAAGVASLIKAVLSLEHKKIPASLNCEKPNSSIDFANSPFYVNTRLSDWTSSDGPRRAGISAFGIGGTNVHVVLEEAPCLTSSDSRRREHLLVLSARTSSALETAISNLADYIGLNNNLNPADVAYTSQVGRSAFEHRCAVIYENCEQLVKSLRERDNPRRVLASADMPRARSVVFMFSGQGSQYVNMARDLYQTEPIFRSNLELCADFLQPHLSADLRTLLFPEAKDIEAASSRLTQTRITQPALFAIEYALAKLLIDWGVQPSAMIGHSIGEYVAACLAGVFSLEDALTLVAERGRLMQQLPPGSMLAVPMTAAQLQPLLDGQIDLAATNEPRLCVVSGPHAAIDQLQQRLDTLRVSFRLLHTSHAFHSRMMDPILEAFGSMVSKLKLSSPQIPYVSNLTGTWIQAPEATSPEYWVRHLRQPVRFAEGLQSLYADDDRILLEVGPGKALCTFARRHPDKTPRHVILSTLRHPQEEQSDTAFLLNSLGRLWLSGVSLDWHAFHRRDRRRRIHLPVYPFERQRYWAELPEATAATPQIVLKQPDIADWFYVPSWEYAISPELPEATTDDNSHWMIFDDGSSLSQEISSLLQQGGNKIITVQCGDAYSKIGSYCYKINPGSSGDYFALFSELSKLKQIPGYVMHLWNLKRLDSALTEEEMFEKYQDFGFYSLLYATQALIRTHVDEPINIGVVTNDLHAVAADELIVPAKATLLGACKSVTQEYPNITFRNIDISETDNPTAAALALIAELTSNPDYPVVAYRGGQRWVQVFEPVRLEDSPEKPDLLRESGVYFITGGLGNIGLAMAEHLARTAKAKLVLSGRSAFPRKPDWPHWLETHPEDDQTSSRIRHIQLIESLGSEVLITSADSADIAQARQALEQTYAHFGALHGVIHAAGNISASGFFAIDQADRSLCERQFQAKVRGLIVLEELLRDKELDFVLLLSSISSVLAGLGYVAYSAGNIFMDAFARRQSQRTEVPWISVNWDTWDFRNVAPEEADPANLAMLPHEGVNALSRILSSDVQPQIIVSTGDLDARIEQWINLRSLREAREARSKQSAHLHARPELANPYVAPRDSVEQAVVEIWQETLGVAQIGVLDNFFTDLSGSSLLSTQLVAQLRNRFHVEFPLRRFFEGPTVADIAAVIHSQIESEAAPQMAEKTAV
jgi:acyl transferase domain-containing protein/acyl carrier protein